MLLSNVDNTHRSCRHRVASRGPWITRRRSSPLALKEPATIVLAVGSNPADFELEHIPGARFILYDQIAVDRRRPQL